jgi:hypothetical protein
MRQLKKRMYNNINAVVAGQWDKVQGEYKCRTDNCLNKGDDEWDELEQNRK